MHLAGAMGIPVCAIFGPTSPVKNKPFGDSNIVFHSKVCEIERNELCLDCSKVWAKTRSLPRCLSEITGREIVDSLNITQDESP